MNYPRKPYYSNRQLNIGKCKHKGCRFHARIRGFCINCYQRYRKKLIRDSIWRIE